MNSLDIELYEFAVEERKRRAALSGATKNSLMHGDSPPATTYARADRCKRETQKEKKSEIRAKAKKKSGPKVYLVDKNDQIKKEIQKQKSSPKRRLHRRLTYIYKACQL